MLAYASRTGQSVRVPKIIRADEVMPLLLASCPSFSHAWARIEGDIEPDGTRLGYVDAGWFSEHLVELLRAGNRDEIATAFAVIERLHVDGDAYVRNLATVGYLEGIQNGSLNADIDPARFEQYLGPESLRWWKGLNAVRSGESRTLKPID